MKPLPLPRVNSTPPDAPLAPTSNACRMTSWTAILALALSANPSDATLTSLDGQSVVGVVDAWREGHLKVTSAAGEQSIPTDSLLDVAWTREEQPAPQRRVELIDGSQVAFEEFTVAQRVATFKTSLAPKPVKISTDKIARIELVAASDALHAVLAEIEQKQPAGDTLVVLKRDGEAMDYLSGMLREVTPQQADFEWDGERVPVKLTKLAAIVFYQAKQSTLPEATCRLTLANGTTIAVLQTTLKENELEVRSVAGVELRIPFNQVTRIDFSSGKITYLSELKPSGMRWTPQVALPKNAATILGHGSPRMNQSFGGSPLSLLWNDDPSPARREVRTYQRGMALRSRTEMTYLIPKGMSRFMATAGIDPSSANQGNVRLEIRGDDQVLWEGTIDGGAPPSAIDVELHAARRLQLVVDYGENLDYGDRLHLVEARFTK